MLFLIFLLTFGCAAGLTAFLTPPLIRLCARYGWMAQPNPRRSHHVPIPTVGGLAMIAGFIGALCLSFALTNFVPTMHRSSFEYLRLGLLLTGLGVVAGISFIDDLHELPALPRLFVHCGAALIAVGPYLWDHTLYADVLGDPTEARGIILTAFNFPFVDQVHLHLFSPWAAIIATILWIVGMQNMINWADGLDGLAAGVTLIAATVLAAHTLLLKQYTVAILPVALAGVCAGFLAFNFHPARIFMGDVGAMSLGYILGASAIIGGAKLATALLVLGAPLIDMAWLIISRTLQGKPAGAAGRDNLHIRLLDLGFSQRQIVAFYYILSATFGSIALIDGITPVLKLVALIILGSVVIGVLIFVSTRTAPGAEKRV